MRPGRRAPLPGRLSDAILSLQPTAYWPLDDGYGALREMTGSAALVALATSADADDIVDTTTPHGMAEGDSFTFTSLTGGANVVVGTTYFVIAASLAAQTFKFSTAAGGAAVDFGSDITAGTIRTPSRLYPASVTGSPTYRVAAPDPIRRGITWSGSGQYATTATSIPVPTASVSVLGLFRTTDATAAQRAFAGRFGVANQSWHFGLTATHGLQFVGYQSGGAANGQATLATASNDGNWCLAVGSFDGTTYYLGRFTAAAGYSEHTSTSLTGTWLTNSSAGIGIAHRNTALLFPGTLAHVGVINDRALRAAETRWLGSIAFGG